MMLIIQEYKSLNLFSATINSGDMDIAFDRWLHELSALLTTTMSENPKMCIVLNGHLTQV